MTDQNKPRVRLPDAIPRKPLLPGPNSWAQAQQQEQQRSSSGEHFGVGHATNRNKYEHKLMPSPPLADSSPHKKHAQAKTYIQPAIPLIDPNAGLQPQKKRAVTDPTASKPLFAGRKISVSKLRKKYSFTKAKEDCPEAEGMPTDQSPPNVGLSSGKAAEVLGLYPPPENKPPASIPLAPMPDLLHSSSDSVGTTTTSLREVQPAPAPTRRYLRENDLPTPLNIEAPVQPGRYTDEHPRSQNKDSKKAENEVLTSGMLHPPRLGRYDNIGEVGLVETNGMHRIESFRGVIESAEPPAGHNGTIGDLLPPISYSPSNYGGIWENDPAVGYSLPPFSPMSNGVPPTKEASRKGLFNERNASTTPNKLINGYSHSNYVDFHLGVNGSGIANANSGGDHQSDFHHPFPSANSWIPRSSFTSTNVPLSAPLPPDWPNNHNNNSVPSPPQNQHDYQRPGSMSAIMARLELTLHHHIDSSTGSLSRLITERHDRIIDQTIRRLEDMEETMNKGLRKFKADFADIRKGFDGLKGEVKSAVESSDRLQDLLKGLDGKIVALEKGVKEHEYMCQPAVTDCSPSTGENEHQYGRAESTHSAFAQGDQRHEHRSGASRSSTSARHSENSNKAHRSNTSKGQATNGISDEIGARREYFAELGAVRGPMPDLRDHPAFLGMQQAQGQIYSHDQNIMPSILNGLPFEHPSLSDGRWYQQAYGQNQRMER